MKIISLIGLWALAFGQQDGQRVPATHASVQHVVATAKNARSIQAELLEEKHYSVLNAPIIAPGEFRYEAPDNVRWQIQGERPQVIVSAGGAVRVKEGEKEKKTGPSEKRVYGMVNALMQGLLNGDLLVDPAMAPEYALVKDMVRITLHPQDEMMAKRIAHIVLDFDKASGLLRTMTTTQTDDDHTVVHFRNVRVDEMLPTGSFTDL